MKSMEGHLRRLRRPVVERLAPPASREQIAKTESELGFKLTAELRALYGCRNGTVSTPKDLLEHTWFFPGYYLLSLDEAAQHARRMRKSRQWKKDWFPVFASGAGDYYAVSCGAGAQPGVIGFLRGEPDQPVEFLDLTAMFATLARAFEERAFFVKGKEFEIDDDKFSAIAIELNPGVDFWEEQAREAADDRDREHARAQATRAWELMSKKKMGQALDLLEPLLERDDLDPFVYVNAIYAAMHGNDGRPVKPARLRRVIDRCLPEGKRAPDVFLNAAFAYVLIGDRENGIRNLQLAKKHGSELKKHLSDKAFAPIRDDRRFVALAKSVGVKLPSRAT
jgi:cell wall assembly regulator SMI1